MGNPLIKFVESVCVQTAVYWGSPTPDGYGGQTYSTPVEIECRWDEKINLIRASNGEEVVSKAQIMLTQDVDEGGYLYLGTLSELDSDPNPEDVARAWKIINISKTPLFRSATGFVYEAFV